MQVIAYDNRMLNRTDRDLIMKHEEKIAHAYERYLAAPAGKRGGHRCPIAVAVGTRYRLYFRENLIVIMKSRYMAGTVSEVGEVRL